MISIQLPGAAIFFPDEEITDAKAITSAGAPAIAFKSAGTGGLQFVKRVRNEKERDETLTRILGTAQKENLTEKLMERIKATEQELDKMRAQQKKKQARRPEKKKRQKKPFLPPTHEEIVKYIKEKNIDEKLDVPAETLAESFRNLYESDEPTGEKDENGFTIYKWKKADGSPVQDWKGCMRTFKARQLVFDAKRTKGKGPRKNQFNEFEQNSYTEEELEEIVNSSVM